MKIIAIEGLDKSGKHTESVLLVKQLREWGYTAVQSEFHRYDTPTGKLIMQWLTKEWDVDQPTIELIMAADKQAQQRWFDELEAQGVDYLVLDRYTASQQIYSHANGISPMFTSMLQRYMRKPDIEILLDVPAEVSMKRKGKHNNGTNDRYESDLQLLKRVREGFKQRKNIVVVDAQQEPLEVHKNIMNALIKEGVKPNGIVR